MTEMGTSRSHKIIPRMVRLFGSELLSSQRVLDSAHPRCEFCPKLCRPSRPKLVLAKLGSEFLVGEITQSHV
jgi:hypothetical protein